jgi:DNA-binding MarR family transcriptional regulator
MSKKDNISKRIIEAGLLLGTWQNNYGLRYANPYMETILTLLKYNTRISEKALAEMLGTGIDRLDRWLEQLEREGLVVIYPEEGGIMMEVSLTCLGARVADKIEKANESTESLFVCLGEEDRARLSEILDKLLVNLKAEIKDDEKEEPEDDVFGGFFKGSCRHKPPFFGRLRSNSRCMFYGEQFF